MKIERIQVPHFEQLAPHGAEQLEAHAKGTIESEAVAFDEERKEGQSGEQKQEKRPPQKEFPGYNPHAAETKVAQDEPRDIDLVA